MNPYITFISFWFWSIENQYFGWNYLPNSPQEVICDGIVLVILGMAINKKEKA